MKNFFKIILIGVIVIFPKISFGADMFLKTQSENYRIGEQFIVTISLLSEEQNPINALDISVGFSQENLKFVQSIESGSIISFFVDRPKIQNGKIVFSGITPSGFFGAINPILGEHKIEPVKIIDLIFEPIASGRAEIFLDKSELFRADGSGLPVVFNTWSKILNIKDEVFKNEINISDTEPPLEFNSQILKDKNISSRYLLIFNTSDEQTGIDRFEVLEKGRKKVIATSPYILKNNPPKGEITVFAYDKAGNVRVSIINAPDVKVGRQNTLIIIAIITLVVFLLQRRKKSHL